MPLEWLTVDWITRLFGWISLINIAIYALSAVFVILLNNLTLRIHSKMFRLDPEQMKLAYFNYLGTFKIFILVFNITPYLALKFFI